MLEPTRITLARRSAGRSLLQLAQALELPVDTLIGYEKNGAPHALAQPLAAATGMQPGFFRKPAAEAVEVDRIFFTAPRRMSTVEKYRCAALARCGIEFYDLTTADFNLPDTVIPDYTGRDAQQAAGMLRLEWNLGSGPIPDLLYLLESHGIRVLCAPKTFSFWDQGRAYIFLEPGSKEQWQHQLAHELGHLVLHSASEQDCTAQREAGIFAAHLLLPVFALSQRVSSALSFTQLLELVEVFNLPACEILSHSYDQGLLDTDAYRWLMQQLAIEPAAAEVPATSKVFSIALPALRSQRRGTAQLAAELGFSPQLVHQLSFGQAMVVLSGAALHEPKRLSALSP